MSAPDGGDDRFSPGTDRFVTAWAKALAGTGYAPMTANEVRGYLRRLTDDLASALQAEVFDVSPGHRTGAALVAANFAAVDALSRTIEVVDERLLTDLELAGDEARQRLRRLVAALAAGYTLALRDRTLDDQESIRRAALVARKRAEQALRASEARFRHAVTHDRLTSLPNRALFVHRLGDLFADPPPGARLGLCAVGLDGFKAVNDSLGHQAGDRLLAAVADRLSRRMAAFGHMVARVGGDEFVILVERTTGVGDAVEVAEQALSMLAAPIDVDGYELRAVASIGIVERPIAGTDPADLMRAADITLHWAKADGGNRWVLFDPARNARDVDRYRLAAAMPAALDRGEFTLEYQPLVDLADGSVVGAEALVRWQHPTLGRLAPARFIDLAEDTGLIVPLGSHLLDQACQQAATWYRTVPDAPYVSVNVAVRQTRHPGLVGEVTDVLARTGLPPARLQLEITESAALGTDRETRATVCALADLGVRIAIDDFGTGYSNLSYLRDLPLRGLKIDGAFVHGPGIPGRLDGADQSILATLVGLGHTLGLTVTAEGVETAAQADRLRAIGCDTAQGWLFGRPGPVDRLVGMFAAA
jgi:diguanylate cyclase (GGDEF)-like protein